MITTSFQGYNSFPEQVEHVKLVSVPMGKSEFIEIPYQKTEYISVPVQVLETVYVPETAPKLKNRSKSQDHLLQKKINIESNRPNYREASEQYRHDFLAQPDYREAPELHRRELLGQKPIFEGNKQEVVFVEREKVRIVEVPHDQIVEVPIFLDVEKREQRIVEVLVEKPVKKEIEKEQVLWKEQHIEKVVERKVPITKEKIVEKVKTVFDDKVVIREVPVEYLVQEEEEDVDHRLNQTTVFEKETSKFEEGVDCVVKEAAVDKVIPVIKKRDFEKIIFLPIEVIREVPVEVVVQVPKTHVVEKIVEVPLVEVVERRIDVPVERPTERLVETIRYEPVDVVTERTVENKVETLVERNIYVEAIDGDIGEGASRYRALPVISRTVGQMPIISASESQVAAQRAMSGLHMEMARRGRPDCCCREGSPGMPGARVDAGEKEWPEAQVTFKQEISTEVESGAAGQGAARVEGAADGVLAAAGVGICLTRGYGDSKVYVECVYEGSPAHLHGDPRVGDELVSVDGMMVHGVSMDFVRQQIMGAVDSLVNLGLQRNGQDLFVSLERKRMIVS